MVFLDVIFALNLFSFVLCAICVEFYHGLYRATFSFIFVSSFLMCTYPLIFLNFYNICKSIYNFFLKSVLCSQLEPRFIRMSSISYSSVYLTHVFPTVFFSTEAITPLVDYNGI